MMENQTYYPSDNAVMAEMLEQEAVSDHSEDKYQSRNSRELLLSRSEELPSQSASKQRIEMTSTLSEGSIIRTKHTVTPNYNSDGQVNK
ncbi:hypothetical protein Trydic_g16995 [Trypoxylus dichotomus]